MTSRKTGRPCRKCEEPIPSKVIIDGKQRILSSRKFCLKCSPFGSHNTRPDDPSKPRRTKIYSEVEEETRKKWARRTVERGKERKQKLIEMAGGSCKVCGYNKCMAALTFHHKDPSTKNFCLTVSNLWSKKWEVILKEFEKCELLCVRCHIEEHYMDE